MAETGELNMLVAEATVDSPRNSEASVAALADGRLLLTWSQFNGAEWGDTAAAQIAARWSYDGGNSWGQTAVLQENISGINCMSASLLQLPSGRLLLAFGRKYRPEDPQEKPLLDAMVRLSDDGGRSWTEARNITTGGAYWCMTNDRLVRLRNGRVIYPLSEERRGCHVWYSDDEGMSWHCGAGSAWIAEACYEEPAVVELAGGEIGMFIRTDAGNIHQWRSADGGQQWSPWKTHPPDMCGHADSGPNSARSPCIVKRLPTGHLLLVWNNNRVRTPLVSGISGNEGENWRHIRQIEPMDGWPPRLTHSYPSVVVQGEHVHLTYWETHSHSEAERLIHLRYRRLPVSWFLG